MEPKKVCVIHLNQIGDLLFSLPVLKALKESAPSAIVHSVIRPHLKDLLVHSSFVDRLLIRKRAGKNIGALLRELRRNRYDLLITLSRSEQSYLLAALSRAKRKAGFSRFLWDFGLDIKVRMEGPPSLSNNLRLLKRLTIEAPKNDYVGLIHMGSDSPSSGVEKLLSVGGHYAVISPGTSARRRMKTWEEEKFADLILLMKERHGLNSVLVGGEESGEISREITERVKKKSKEEKSNHLENLVGKTDLKELCALLRGATLFVGVDSGIMHLASSFDVPVVGIFGPTDPFYVGPQNRKSRVVRKEMACSPCYLKGCEERLCMKNLKVEKVLEACDELLREEMSWV